MASLSVFTFSFWRAAALPITAFALVVLASNICVQYPVHALHLDEVLTYGAFTYPVAFLVTDLVNRHYGAGFSRRVVLAGFVPALLLSLYFATPRIAAASGMAFLVANLTDVQIFDRLRTKAWWMPPMVSSLISSSLDTMIFFAVAFAGDAQMSAPVALGSLTVPLWAKLAVFDYLIKLAMAGAMIMPYGALRPWIRASRAVH